MTKKTMALAAAFVGLLQTTGSAGQREGIKVHGHWTIDVRQPDGSLVSHQEFENSLLPDGAKILGRFLQRTSKAGLWRIALGGAFGTAPCRHPDGSRAGCYIGEPGDVFARDGTPTPEMFFPSLTIHDNASGGIVLQGSAKTSFAGQIESVNTTLGGCVPDIPMNGCVNIPEVFSGTVVKDAASVEKPVDVAAGQTIDVTVKISFS